MFELQKSSDSKADCWKHLSLKKKKKNPVFVFFHSLLFTYLLRFGQVVHLAHLHLNEMCSLSLTLQNDARVVQRSLFMLNK